ncbi:unnamed protein product, partial [Thelazia callipaeda]|uniref:Product n=1 Tax=Thelazia callipaeda TaxID=103827 RepID=A0A0N5DAR9_THECL
ITKYFFSNYFISKILLNVTYFPCLINFCHSDHRNEPCFKLMILIGIVDLISINNDLTITGFFSIFGYSYCMAPIFSIFFNFISLNSWFVYGSLCILLNFMRCYQLSSNKLPVNLVFVYL